MMVKIYIGILFLFLAGQLQSKESKKNRRDSFEFAFLTDIHLKPEMGAPIGFQMAIDKVNQLKPDFVMFGGDQVFDAMRGNQHHCDSLFTLFKNMATGFNMPVHYCVGNHDLFAIYNESPENENHPDYKYGMFERYFGKTYYSFNHKGWHFIVLNSVDVTNDKKYRNWYSADQLQWLKSDLAQLARQTPIVLVTHIPLLSIWPQLKGGATSAEQSNSPEVFKLLEPYNLKLVLQGHIHWKEFGVVNDRFQYLTGGSVAGNGWKGRRHNTKEGFILVKVKGTDFSWEYIDHGWEEVRLRKSVQTN